MNKKEQTTTEFRVLFNKLAWLNKQKMEEALKEYKPSEVHCIESIGKSVDPNVTKLAESLYMTRGAISKITKKLIKKDVIESYQKPENKKEIYFKLTEQGKKCSLSMKSFMKNFVNVTKWFLSMLRKRNSMICLGL